MGKLDPRAVKCVFVGYSATQKGYVCWSPVERRLFVSMDVTFRESEPYYSSEVMSPFVDSIDTGSMSREGENGSGQRIPDVGLIPLEIPSPIERDGVVEEEEKEEDELVDGGNQARGGADRVYTRRRRQDEVPVTAPTEPLPLVPSPLSLSTPTLETPTSSTTEYTGDTIPLSTPPISPPVRRTTCQK